MMRSGGRQYPGTISGTVRGLLSADNKAGGSIDDMLLLSADNNVLASAVEKGRTGVHRAQVRHRASSSFRRGAVR